jgi:hypothetical protein
LRDIYIEQHILHAWDDEHCKKLLSNSVKASPLTGKVTMYEMVVPSINLEGGSSFRPHMFIEVMGIMTITSGGMERTKQQWEQLLTRAGFSKIRFVEIPSKNHLWLIEALNT